jgi:8-oxo-dGTP pyrophosphatase MutT (NUDIX family)
MGASARNPQDSRLTVVQSRVRTHQPSGRFVRLSQLRKLCECEQVAAVCYRIHRGGIEFLLVQTRGSGRWTFPKGSAELGLTHAQAAALEAFEEAGVHGRIEEVAFTRYVRRKGDARKSTTRSAQKEPAVNAHLCEVLRLSPPKESNRNRTWLSVEDARQRLREGRKSDDGAEFARVIDRAVARIQQRRGRKGIVDDRVRQPRLGEWQKDPLQRVQFEVSAEAYGRVTDLVRMRHSSVPTVAQNPGEVLQGQVLQFGPPREKKPKALGTGTKSG